MPPLFSLLARRDSVGSQIEELNVNFAALWELDVRMIGREVLRVKVWIIRRNDLNAWSAGSDVEMSLSHCNYRYICRG